MAKKTRTKTLTNQQRLRRTDGRIVRVEVSLNADRTGDIFIADRLSELPPGITKSDYLREALLNQIAIERRETDTDQEIAALRAEISDLKNMIADLMQGGIKIQMAQAMQVTMGAVPPQPVTLPEIQQEPRQDKSSGLDMSRPRPRAKLKRGPVIESPEHEEIKVTDEYLEMLGKQMAQSIKNANPGKGNR